MKVNRPRLQVYLHILIYNSRSFHDFQGCQNGKTTLKVQRKPRDYVTVMILSSFSIFIFNLQGNEWPSHNERQSIEMTNSNLTLMLSDRKLSITMIIHGQGDRRIRDFRDSRRSLTNRDD